MTLLWCLKNVKLRDGVYAIEMSSLRLVWTKYESYILHTSAAMYTFQKQFDLTLIDWLSWGLTTRQPLWVILCRLPEKGRKKIEEIVEEMKERDREERGTGMKVKKQKK